MARLCLPVTQVKCGSLFQNWKVDGTRCKEKVPGSYLSGSKMSPHWAIHHDILRTQPHFTSAVISYFTARAPSKSERLTAEKQTDPLYATRKTPQIKLFMQDPRPRGLLYHGPSQARWRYIARGEKKKKCRALPFAKCPRTAPRLRLLSLNTVLFLLLKERNNIALDTAKGKREGKQNPAKSYSLIFPCS